SMHSNLHVQFRTVAITSVSEKLSRGRRRARMDCGVKSRICPKESVYSSGFFVSNWERSVPGGGAFRDSRKKRPIEKMRQPNRNRATAEILPARRSLLLAGDSTSRLSHPPINNAKASTAGMV